MALSVRHANLLFDTWARPPFGGSCGMVTHSLRKAFRTLGYSTEDHYYPLSDKSSPIQLQQLKKGSAETIHVSFEELFHRSKKKSGRRDGLNIVFFNLHYLGKDLGEICKADGLLFNSKYLLRCFHAAAQARGLKAPPATWVPLPLPLLEFPRGYPSDDPSIDPRYIRNLSKKVTLGHALRPRKSDPFATLSIIYHLNRLARGTKPFHLLIHPLDFERYEITLREMGLPPETMKYFHQIPFLSNAGVISIMRKCAYSLCYDTCLEAFGYYLIESVFCRVPVFTNGVANLRHILPPRHGVESYETLSMHFGPIDKRIQAYAGAAERIFRSVRSGAGARQCSEGARFINRTYSDGHLQARLEKFLQRVRREMKSPGPGQKKSKEVSARFIRSPYLRIANWSRGRFVTDLGNLEVTGPPLKKLQLLRATHSSTAMNTEWPDHRVLCRPHPGSNTGRSPKA